MGKEMDRFVAIAAWERLQETDAILHAMFSITEPSIFSVRIRIRTGRKDRSLNRLSDTNRCTQSWAWYDDF